MSKPLAKDSITQAEQPWRPDECWGYRPNMFPPDPAPAKLNKEKGKQ